MSSLALLKIYNIELPSGTKKGDIITFKFNSKETLIVIPLPDNSIYRSGDYDEIKKHEDNMEYLHNRYPGSIMSNKQKLINFDGIMTSGIYLELSRIDNCPLVEVEIDEIISNDRNNKISKILE